VTTSADARRPHSHRPRVSIVIPTFNRASLLRSAIESVLGQDFTDVCLIVADDASTDETSEVVASFADQRIHYLRQPYDLGGWLPNSNSAYRCVDSEFVGWMGDDDQMLPGALSRAVAAFDAHPSVGLVHASFNYVDADGTVIVPGATIGPWPPCDTFESGRTYIRKAMRYGTLVCSPSSLMRTAALPPVPFDPDEGPTADAGLYMRIGLNWDVYFIAAPAVNYRLHRDSDSAIWSRLAGDRYRPTMRLVRRVRTTKLRFIDTYGEQVGSPTWQLWTIAQLATLRSVAARAVPDSVAVRLRRTRALVRS